MQTPTGLCQFPISRLIVVRRRSEKYVLKDSKYAHWIGLYLSFHLNWVLGPFVHGRLQNLRTSEVTFAHVITPLNNYRYTLYGKHTYLLTLVLKFQTIELYTTGQCSRLVV